MLPACKQLSKKIAKIISELCCSSKKFIKMSKIVNQLNAVTSYLLIFLFTYTGISKLINHVAFQSTLLQSPAIREQATLISWLIPFVELVIVALLLFDRSRNMGLLLSLGIMILFTVYIGYMVLFVPHLPCSCGGVLQLLSWPNHIFFNSALILLIIAALLSSTKHNLFIAINRTSRKPV